MLLATHIIIALASLVYTTYVFFAPSEAKLKVSYAFVAATIGSGTLLVISMPAHLVSACYSGLTYLAIMLVGILGVRYRLGQEEKVRIRIDNDKR
jgi:hypothetical protein